MTISFWWNSHVNDDDDDENLSVHCHEHECLNHVRELCERIEKRYPNSSVGASAMYTDGLACERLGNMNGWWREYPWIVDHAVHCLTNLAAKYPKSKLAKPATKYAKVFAEEATRNRNF